MFSNEYQTGTFYGNQTPANTAARRDTVGILEFWILAMIELPSSPLVLLVPLSTLYNHHETSYPAPKFLFLAPSRTPLAIYMAGTRVIRSICGPESICLSVVTLAASAKPLHCFRHLQPAMFPQPSPLCLVLFAHPRLGIHASHIKAASFPSSQPNLMPHSVQVPIEMRCG
jgi:hypothetical protein